MKKTREYKKVILTLAAASLFLTSCATQYQAKGWMGGYSEIVKARDTFEVIFEGNSYSEKNIVRKYAYRRAAELAISHGFKYFMVVAEEDQSSTKKSLKTLERETSSLDTYNNILNIVDPSKPEERFSIYSYVPKKKEKSTTTFVEKSIYPAIRLSIKCFNTRPEGLDVVDAEYFMLANV